MSKNRIAANKARRVDLSGQEFERLLVLEYIEEISKYLCKCICGNKIQVSAGALKSGNTKSCGCLQKDRARQAALKKHKNIRKSKGLPEDQPISSENILQRLSLKNLTQEVFKRDSYCCAMCSQVGSELQAHHIKSWAYYPEQRGDIDNIVTLCKTCHYQVHDYNWFGTPNIPLNILLTGYIAVMKEKINEPV